MKPENTNSEIILGDGEPVRCRFRARSDQPPHFSEECEQNATTLFDFGELTRFRQWQEDHPKHTIYLRPGAPYLCDTHANTIRDCL